MEKPNFTIPTTPTSPLQPQPNQIQLRKLSPRIFIYILILLILFTTGVVWGTPYFDEYLPTIVKEWMGKTDNKIPDSDNISDWETFENSDFGFSFKYPSNYVVGEISNYENEITGSWDEFSFTDNERPGKPRLILGFSSSNFPTAADPLCTSEEEFLTDLINYDMEFIDGEERIKVSEREAAREVRCPGDDFDPHRVAIQSFLYVFDKGYDAETGWPPKRLSASFSFDNSGPNYEQEFVKMLETFNVNRSKFKK